MGGSGCSITLSGYKDGVQVKGSRFVVLRETAFYSFDMEEIANLCFI